MPHTYPNLVKYVHVSVYTFSGAVYASAHTGEKATDAQKHLVQAFSILGIPKVIKTDNGPTYASKAFDEFLQQWGVEHNKGQAIIERIHQSLKRVLEQQGGDNRVLAPQLQLCKALFTVNFLNCFFENLNPAVVRHFSQNVSLRLREHPPVVVKNPETWEVEGPYELVT
ncbi:hypothetical protein HGM15179_017701 [Zosterops borbonicus]|uniref:Integrase catalytic domain-containing protein n=1 Tax=Zosterops borbonicus TaxID=364589 RepID=A0A8K1G0C5_9PASS|nr:hypothetical protein HGM15179_017701 [Zosterops borbonicus]